MWKRSVFAILLDLPARVRFWPKTRATLLSFILTQEAHAMAKMHGSLEGLPVVPEVQLCTCCYGIGHVPCNSCGGTGKVGFAAGNLGETWDQTCGVCFGLEYASCELCGGTGFHQ